ncbi:MAG: hypothetical protein II922_10245 [Succinimonas sp.]|nr:hypothetical protein [Succinimonas sp.]
MFFRLDNLPDLSAFLFSVFEEEEDNKEHADKDDETGKEHAHEEGKGRKGIAAEGHRLVSPFVSL